MTTTTEKSLELHYYTWQLMCNGAIFCIIFLLSSCRQSRFQFDMCVTSWGNIDQNVHYLYATINFDRWLFFLFFNFSLLFFSSFYNAWQSEMKIVQKKHHNTQKQAKTCSTEQIDLSSKEMSGYEMKEMTKLENVCFATPIIQVLL